MHKPMIIVHIIRMGGGLDPTTSNINSVYLLRKFRFHPILSFASKIRVYSKCTGKNVRAKVQANGQQKWRDR